MKSRASSCEGYLLGKDLGRFAPVWGGYLVCLLLGGGLLAQNDLRHSFARNLAALPQLMAFINCCYGLICAQCLFGDLFSTRLSYGLHALPVKRQQWFAVHTRAGILFSLIPTAIFCGCCLPLVVYFSSMVDGWQIPGYVFLGMNLEYLFFFALAVLCACCAGSRVGGAVLYAIANLTAYLIYFLADTVYIPLLQGVKTVEEQFTQLCPVVRLAELPFLSTWQHGVYGEEGVYYTFQVSRDWWYLAALAMVGLVLLALGRWMYCRRRLETAGDFLATRKLKAPFMVLFSLSAGATVHMLSNLMESQGSLPVFLLAGTAVGWFAGRMLLEGQIRVFRRAKSWLGLGLLLAVFCGSLWLTKLDPLGIRLWVPQAESVASAQLSLGYGSKIETEDPQQIQRILTLHQNALAENVTDEDVEAAYAASHKDESYVTPDGEMAMQTVTTGSYRRAVQVQVGYTLKNGWTLCREYWVWVDSDQGREVAAMLGSIEAIFGEQGIADRESLMEYVRQPRSIQVDGYTLPPEQTNPEVVRELLEALAADCESGDMIQVYAFHADDRFPNGSHAVYASVHYASDHLYFDIFPTSEHCIAWMEKYGLTETFQADPRG